MGIAARHSTSFCPLFWISQVLGIATCALAIYQGKSNDEFNWHIVITTVGMVYFFGIKLLTYRVLNWLPIKTLHIFHAGAGSIVIVATVLGYLTAYCRIRKMPGGVHWSTMHDWVAVLSTILFVAQWVFSVTAYIYPKLSVSLRICYLPLHIFIGHVTFVLVIGSALLGLSDLIRLEKQAEYTISSIGFLMIGFATTVVYLSSTQHYKRVPLDIE